MESKIYYNIDIRNDDPRTPNEPILAKFQEERTQELLTNPINWNLSIIRFQVPGNLIPILFFPIQDYREASGPISVLGGIGPGRITITTTDTSNLQNSDLIDISGTPNIDSQYEIIKILSPTTFEIEIAVLSVLGIGTFNKVQDPNQSVLSITLEHDGDIIQKFIRWQTQDPLLNPPAIPTAQNPQWSRKNGYYACFSYQHIISIINDTFILAYNDLTSPPIGSEPPYVQYVSGKLSWVIQKSAYLENLPDIDRIDIYGNARFVTYFLPFSWRGFMLNAPNGKDEQLVIKDIPSQNFNPSNAPAIFPPDYLLIEQEYNTLYLWNSFKDLVFITNSIPVVYEYIRNNREGLVNFSPILTDFEPSFTNPGESRSTLQYFPQGPYRLINMNSTTPLKRIDIQIFWKDELNNLYPVLIAKGQSASLKILFRRRLIKQYKK